MKIWLDRQINCEEVNEGLTIITEAHQQWTTGWLGCVKRGETFPRTKTEFCHGDKSDLSRAGNGRIEYSDLSNGYYEAESVWRSGQARRYFFSYADQEITFYNTKKQLVAALWESTEEAVKKASDEFVAKIEANAKNALGVELPPLTGSDKQIKWAESLRIQVLTGVRKYIDSIDLPAEQFMVANNLFAFLARHTKAGYWIDLREVSPYLILQNELKDHPELLNSIQP